MKNVKFVLKYPEKCKQCDKKDTCSYTKDVTAEGLLLDCQAFYLVFCKLEEDCHIPFDAPEKMKQYMDSLETGNRPYLTPPLVMTGAFAAELALKFLTFQETTTFRCCHNLEILYSELPDKYKDALSKRIKRQAHQNDETLAKNLCQMANLFDEWRYFYEKGSLGYTGFFNDFVHIVCDYVLCFKQEQGESNDIF